MLALYDRRALPVEPPSDLAAAPLPSAIVWIDLLKPDAGEIAFVEKTTGLAVPGLAELSEIESSSRLRAENGALYLSAPLVYRADSDDPLGTPVGFVLTRDRLITVRFEALTAFDSFSRHIVSAAGAPLGGAGAFAGLLEAIVDRVADVLERIASELD